MNLLTVRTCGRSCGDLSQQGLEVQLTMDS